MLFIPSALYSVDVSRSAPAISTNLSGSEPALFIASDSGTILPRLA